MTEGLRVLSLGFTRELWEDAGGAGGDTRARLSAYSEQLAAYHVIAHSLRSHGLESPRQITPTLWAHATNGRGPVGSWLRMLSLARRLARVHAFDLVQSQDPVFTGTVGHILSRWFGLPHNVCVYGSNPFDRNWTRESAWTRAAALVGRAVLRAAHGIQVDGLRTQARLVEAGLSTARITLKPTVPLDLDVFLDARPDPALRAELSAGGRFDQLLLFVGRLARQKDVPLLLEAVRRLAPQHPGLRLVCVGDGPERTRLEERAAAAGLADRVLWAGARPRADVARLMATCDALVLPSRYEGFARVLVEAAAAARPIVCTDVSGADEAVRDGETGLVVPVGDVAALHAGLGKILSEPLRAQRMGQRGRDHIRNLVARRASPLRQIEIWRGLVSSRRGRISR